MTLDIQSTDTTGLRVTQTVTVTLVDVNEAGVSVILNVNGLATSKPNVPYPSNLNAVIGQVWPFFLLLLMRVCFVDACGVDASVSVDASFCVAASLCVGASVSVHASLCVLVFGR